MCEREGGGERTLKREEKLCMRERGREKCV